MSDEEWFSLSNPEKCAWYVDEMERQWSEIVKPLLNEDQCFEVNLEDILRDNTVLDELESFICLPLFRDRIGKPINTRV